MTSSPRWLRYTLIASLALNVFFIGALATHWLSRGHLSIFGPPPRNPITAVLGDLPHPARLHRVFSEEQKALLKDVWHDHRSGIRVELGRVFVAHHDVVAAIRANDREALQRGFTALRDAREELAMESQGMLADLAGRLDADGREKLASVIEPPPFKKRHDKKERGESRKDGRE